MKNQAAVLFLAVLYFHQGDALKCYTCTSATDQKCNDPIDPSLVASECTPDLFKEGAGFLKGAADGLSKAFGNFGINIDIPVPDPNAPFACIKGVKQDGDKRVVVRSCGLAKSDKFDFCAQMRAAGGIVTSCTECDTDACNAAAGVAPSLLLMLAASLAVLFGVLAKQ